MLLEEYNIKIYSGGGFVITSGTSAKIKYNTGDIVYLKDGCVVAIVASDGRVMFGERILELDIVEVPKKTNELKHYLLKKELLSDLDKDPHCYDKFVSEFIPGDNNDITTNTVKRFFNIVERCSDCVVNEATHTDGSKFYCSVHRKGKSNVKSI